MAIRLEEGGDVLPLSTTGPGVLITPQRKRLCLGLCAQWNSSSSTMYSIAA